MVTAPADGRVSSGSLPSCERCFTRHVGSCTIKCYKCVKVVHKTRYRKEKNVSMGVNALPIPTCYDCGEQGHTRNRWPRKVKQEEVEEVRSRAYAIKDAEPKGHTRNRCPKKVKQEEVGEVCGRAYAIKDTEPKGPNVVTELRDDPPSEMKLKVNTIT
nr:hypothetical protein [Tanacetum cinerariifolium]